jgi:hypothetical protein
VDRSPNAADEHQAHDAGLELVCAGLGDVVAGTGLGLVVLGLEDALPGTVLGRELGDRVDAADTLAKSNAAGPRVPTSAYPPAAAAASTHSVAARGTSFLGFL